MASGLGVPKEPGTDLFAHGFHSAGFSVLAFDYRHIGGSDGTPRGTVRVKDQIADFHRAIETARSLPEVDDERIGIWGFSLSGGHVIQVAATNTGVAAAVAQNPNADGVAASRNAMRHQRPGALFRFTARAVGDTVRGVLGREPWMVPVAGAPGTVAVLTTPDALDADRALDPAGEHSGWTRTIAARSALPLGRYRPGKQAKRVRIPLLVLVCNEDQSALAEPGVLVASSAPRGELMRMPGGHYELFLAGHEQAVASELDFLTHHLAQPALTGGPA